MKRRLATAAAFAAILAAGGEISIAADSLEDARGVSSVREQALKINAGPRPLRCASAVYGPAGGAYYREVASVADPRIDGLRGQVRLPEVRFDDMRSLTPAAPGAAWQAGPLDRPAVYVGARSRTGEIDAGLTWDRVYLPDGRASDAPGAAAFAYRLFWRTAGPSGNDWHNPPKESPQNVYFQPGEEIVMTIRWLGEDRLGLEIASRSDSAKNFALDFPAEGFGGTEGRTKGFVFKRVDSIDQFRVDADGARRGDEGRPVIATEASAAGAVWQEVFLLGAAGETRAPLAGEACVDVIERGPAAGALSIETLDSGGERIDISPPAARR